MRGFLRRSAELALNDIQIVHQRLEERRHLGIFVAGQEADILIAQDDGGAGDVDMVEVVFLFESCRQCKQGLAGARAAGQGDQLHFGVQEGVESHLLLVVTGFDAVCGMCLYQHYPVAVFVEPRTNGIRAPVSFPMELEQLVGLGLLLHHILPVDGIVGTVYKLLQHLRTEGVELHLAVGILYLCFVHTVGQIILHLHSGGLGFHPQVHILGDQRHEGAGMIVPHPDGGSEDAVVLDVIYEKVLQFIREGVVGLHFYKAQVLAYGQTFLSEGLAVGDLVQVPEEMAGIVRQRIVALLELVEFFHHGDGNHEVIVPETPDGFVIVQRDVGVQHEDFWFTHFSAFSLPLLPPDAARGMRGYFVCRSWRKPSPARPRCLRRDALEDRRPRPATGVRHLYNRNRYPGSG